MLTTASHSWWWWRRCIEEMSIELKRVKLQLYTLCVCVSVFQFRWQRCESWHSFNRIRFYSFNWWWVHISSGAAHLNDDDCIRRPQNCTNELGNEHLWLWDRCKSIFKYFIICTATSHTANVNSFNFSSTLNQSMGLYVWFKFDQTSHRYFYIFHSMACVSGAGASICVKSEMIIAKSHARSNVLFLSNQKLVYTYITVCNRFKVLS